MQQQYCRNFLNSVARSVICLALFAPACDYADDRIKSSHPSYHPHNSTGSKSNGYYYGLRARKSTDISGVHRNTGSNTYHDGLNRSQSQQDQRKKKSVTRNSDTDTNGSLREKTGNSHVASTSDSKKPKQFNKTTGFREEKKQIRKNTVNTATAIKSYIPTGVVSQYRYPVKKQYHTGKYSSNEGRKHYNESSHKANMPDKLHTGKNEQKKYQLKTRHGHNEYFNKYKKHKKHIVKRRPVSRVFFIGYSLIPYSYYAYYDYYYPGLLTYSVPAYSYNESNYISGPAYNRGSSGWVQLTNGQVFAAMDSFTREMESYPNAGIPKVGYALAVAADGDLTRAVLAMREALRFDPDSLQYIYLNKKLYDLVDNLIDQYEHLLHFNNRRPDEAFMVSALYFLEMDYISAHDAIGRAISDGDSSLSTNNLHGIINAKLQENYAGDYN